jgi:hypothetical protein
VAIVTGRMHYPVRPSERRVHFMKNQRHLDAKAATGRDEVISMANTMFGEAHIAGWNGK